MCALPIFFCLLYTVSYITLPADVNNISYLCYVFQYQKENDRFTTIFFLKLIHASFRQQFPNQLLLISMILRRTLHIVKPVLPYQDDVELVDAACGFFSSFSFSLYSKYSWQAVFLTAIMAYATYNVRLVSMPGTGTPLSLLSEFHF